MNYLEENGIIDVSYIQEVVEMEKRKTILANHPYKIWEGKDSYWHTYLVKDDGTLQHKKRKHKDDIEKDVVQYYIDKEERPKFREVYQKWIAEKEECGELEANSITRYDNAFERYFPPDEPFCDIRLCNMTDGKLEKFIKLTIKKFNMTKKTYSMFTLILRGVFKFAKREKYTTFDITSFFNNLVLKKNIFEKKYVNPKSQVFTRKEARQLINYFQNNPTVIHLGLILAFYTGVRIGELCTLKRSDNIEKYFLTIQRTEVTYKDKALNKYVTTIKESTKGDETRVIDLPKKAQAIIDQLYLLNPNGEYLFMDNKGRIKSKRFNYYLTKACRELGIQEKTSHKMRKTYGSNLLEKEVGEAIVQGQLGHKQISTTHNFYHYDITDDDERSDIINQAVVY